MTNQLFTQLKNDFITRKAAFPALIGHQDHTLHQFQRLINKLSESQIPSTLQYQLSEKYADIKRLLIFGTLQEPGHQQLLLTRLQEFTCETEQALGWQSMESCQSSGRTSGLLISLLLGMVLAVWQKSSLSIALFVPFGIGLGHGLGYFLQKRARATGKLY